MEARQCRPRSLETLPDRPGICQLFKVLVAEMPVAVRPAHTPRRPLGSTPRRRAWRRATMPSPPRDAHNPKDPKHARMGGIQIHTFTSARSPRASDLNASVPARARSSHSLVGATLLAALTTYLVMSFSWSGGGSRSKGITSGTLHTGNGSMRILAAEKAAIVAVSARPTWAGPPCTPYGLTAG